MKKENKITNENSKKSIARKIRRANNNFTLLYAECDVINNIPILISQFANDFNFEILTVEINNYDINYPFDQWIINKIAEHDKNVDAVAVIGFDKLTKSKKFNAPEVFIQMNCRRNFYRDEVSKPLVLFMGSDDMRVLAVNACDFFDWHSGTNKFFL